MINQFYYFISLQQMERSLNPERVNILNTEGSQHQSISKKNFFKSSRTVKQLGTTEALAHKNTHQKNKEKQFKTFLTRKREISHQNIKHSDYPQFKQFFRRNMLSSKSPSKPNPKSKYSPKLRKQIVFSASGQFQSKRAQSIEKAKSSLPISMFSPAAIKESILIDRQSLPKPKALQETEQIGKASWPALFFSQKTSTEIIKKRFPILQSSHKKKKPIQAFQLRLSPPAKNFVPTFVRKRTEGQIYHTEEHHHSSFKIPSFLKKTTHLEKKIIFITDFRIVKPLGVGKFGEYFMAIHKKSRFVLTIKRMKKAKIATHKLVEKIVRSIKRQYSMNHKHIRSLFGIFDDQSYVYLALEYMQGTLGDQLREKTRFPEREAVQKLYEIGQAVKYIHENGFIHRDIRLESIYTCHNVCKLCNFQLSTPYSQKEQLRETLNDESNDHLDFKAVAPSFDVLCLGLMAYHMFAGKSVAPGSMSKSKSCNQIHNVSPNKMDFPKFVPRGARALISKLLEPVAKSRITVQQLLQDVYLNSQKYKNQWEEPEKSVEKCKERKEKEEKSRIFLRKKFHIDPSADL